MYTVEFYYDKEGHSDVVDWLDELKASSDTNKNNRILFFYWEDNKFVLLHHFVKKTQKTPRKEIDTAIRRKNEYLSREVKHE